LPELTRTPQLRWWFLSPALAPLIAKSSWLTAILQDLQGRLKTSTLKTSPQTSYLLTHLQTRCLPTGTLDVSVTGSAVNGAGVSETTSPFATLRKLSRRSRAEYTLPLRNASCRSQRWHARLREFAPQRSSPSSLKTPMSYGPPRAHYLGGYQDRLLGGPLGLPGLRYTAPEGVEHKDYTGVVLG
jgi:hypothetical protein